MEEQRRECDKRRVMLPRVGGGGGPAVTLIVWGGALAVAGLVAAFSVKKRRNSIVKEEETARSCRKEEEVEDKSDGLRFVLHQSSSPTLSLNPCSVSCETPPKIGVTQIDDCITGNLMDMGIMEEKDDASSGECQEILLSDSEKESIVISNDGDSDAEEEFSVPILENMAVDEPEKVISVTSMEPSNMKIEDEAVTAEWMMIEEDMTEKTSFSGEEDDEEAVTAEEETSEQSPSSTEGIEEIEEEMSMESQLQVGEEENHYRTESSLSSSESEECWPNQPASTEEDEEVVTEESEESSKEGGSSTETNEAIWPAEMIDASSAGHRKTIINYQNSGERFEQRDRNSTEVQELLSNSQKSSDCYRLDNEKRERSRTNNKEAQELVVVVHEGKHLIRWQIALCSVVLPLLLLLLAHWIITPKYFF